MGYTLAAGPFVRSHQNGTEGLSAGAATIPVSGAEMQAYYARPTEPRSAVILVAMEVFGLHEHIKDVTRRLGALGAFAVAPDIYFRLGDLPKSRNRRSSCRSSTASPTRTVFRFDATVTWRAASGDTNRLGSSAFAGAPTVWLYAAHNASLKAVLPFTAASWIPRGGHAEKRL